jgi:hypothetical protein
MALNHRKVSSRLSSEVVLQNANYCFPSGEVRASTAATECFHHPCTFVLACHENQSEFCASPMGGWLAVGVEICVDVVGIFIPPSPRRKTGSLGVKQLCFLFIPEIVRARMAGHSLLTPIVESRSRESARQCAGSDLEDEVWQRRSARNIQYHTVPAPWNPGLLDLNRRAQDIDLFRRDLQRRASTGRPRSIFKCVIRYVTCVCAPRLLRFPVSEIHVVSSRFQVTVRFLNLGRKTVGCQRCYCNIRCGTDRPGLR